MILHPQPSTLESGFMLMGIGGGWLLVARIMIGTWGDEATMLKNPTFAFSNVNYLKQLRPIVAGVARWFVRPAAWGMIIVGASMFLAGLIRSALAGAPGV